MKVLSYCFIAVFTLISAGCPGEPSEEAKPVSKLPMCFYAVSDNVVIKSVKVFQNNGEESYFACGTGYEFSNKDELGLECDLQGNEVFLEAQDSRATGLTGPAKEISEHCVDDPIDGRCKKWNCEELSNLVPYPNGCYKIGKRATGSCSEMWKEWVD